MAAKYEYEPWVYEEIERCIRGLFPPRTPLRRASREEDFGGIDVRYIVDDCMPLQVRTRFNRPAYASDIDVTFRSTEPRMMGAGTYAPVALFTWFVGRYIKAGKLVDVYQMAARLMPPFAQRRVISNDDGTSFYSVGISELHDARAFLRNFDGNNWNTITLGGEDRLNRILDLYRQRADPTLTA